MEGGYAVIYETPSHQKSRGLIFWVVNIDRKVKILLSLRRGFPSGDFPSGAFDEDNAPDVAPIDDALETNISSEFLQIPGTTQPSKMNERRGNLTENKTSVQKTPETAWNVYENTGDASGIRECC